MTTLRRLWFRLIRFTGEIWVGGRTTFDGYWFRVPVYAETYLRGQLLRRRQVEEFVWSGVLP